MSGFGPAGQCYPLPRQGGRIVSSVVSTRVRVLALAFLARHAGQAADARVGCVPRGSVSLQRSSGRAGRNKCLLRRSRQRLSQTTGRFCFVPVRYRYRLYPTPGQQQALARAFGCARVVFNDALRTRQQAHEAGLATHHRRRVVRAADRMPRPLRSGRGWATCSAVILQQALADLNAAYRNFFASCYGQAEGPEGRRRPDSGPARTAGRPSGSRANARFRVLPEREAAPA